MTPMWRRLCAPSSIFMVALVVRESRTLKFSGRALQALLIAAAMAVHPVAMLSLLVVALLALPRAIASLNPNGCRLEPGDGRHWYVTHTAWRGPWCAVLRVSPPAFMWFSLLPPDGAAGPARQLLLFRDALCDADYRSLRRQFRIMSPLS